MSPPSRSRRRLADSTSYDDVLRWRPGLLPYGAARDATHFHRSMSRSSARRGEQPRADAERLWAAAAAAQDAAARAREFASANVSAAVASGDVDLAAALVDVLRSFAVDESSASPSAAPRKSVDFLLRRQRAHGTWPAAAASPQAVYHRHVLRAARAQPARAPRLRARDAAAAAAASRTTGRDQGTGRSCESPRTLGWSGRSATCQFPAVALPTSYRSQSVKMTIYTL